MPQVAKQTGRQGGRQRPIRAAAQTTKLAAKRQPIKANLVAATPCGDTKNNHWKNGDNNKYNSVCKWEQSSGATTKSNLIQPTTITTTTAMVAKIMYAQIFCKNFHIFCCCCCCWCCCCCGLWEKCKAAAAKKIKVRLLLLCSVARSAFSRQKWLFSKSIAGQNQKHCTI